jgi:hypothetical protein
VLGAAALALAVVSSSAAAAGDDVLKTRTPRVRPHDGRSAALLLQGIERSKTMRFLVERLEALNVIVYIETRLSQRQLAGRMVWLAKAENFRYVRISLNPELTGETLVAVLGHELQHALEVALSPSIVDERSLQAFYSRNGISMSSHTNGWDTIAARDTGELVRREIAHTPSRSGALDVPQSFDASAWPAMYRRVRDRSGLR